MKKILVLFVALFMYAGYVSSQTVLYEDNLDTYALNSFLGVVNPTWWTTWSNAPGGGEDIQMKNNFAHSAPMSGSADKVGGQSDAILKLGNKVSGAYELKWYMYVETGKCGYYNIQHMQSPGTEWAFEVYFRTSGALELLVAGVTTNGSYIKDQWVEVKHDINLDKDSIWMYIDGVLLSKWKFSDQASTAGGTKQLGGVDFFAGEKTGTGETPGYYIDDIYYAETQSGAVPIIAATPDSTYKFLVGGTNGTETMTVDNIGTAPLDFDVNIVYDLDALKSAPISTVSGNNHMTKMSLSNIKADPTPNPGPPCPFYDATAQLHYDGDNASAVGWNTVPTTVTVAARFPNSMTLPYAGLDLTSVEVFVNDLNTPPASNLMKLRIYGMGNTYEPGPMIYEQEFTPAGAAWETITLTTPIKVTGEDLWVGYNLTQTTPTIYIPGTDGGPADPNGDFLSTGVGWSHLFPGLDYNWNIRANLVGTAAAHWLTVSPMTGTVAAAATKPLTLTFNTTGLSLGRYTAIVKLLSNDLTNPVMDVPVVLDVVGVGVGENAKTAVMVFPNPVKDQLNIVTNGTVTNITITDMNGKVVYNGMSQKIDFSNFSAGNYLVKVQTAQGTSTSKFVKN